VKLIINGIEKEFNESMTLLEIIQELDIFDKVMAAAINMEIVKKDNWAVFIPQNGDKLELLEFVGGG